MWGASAVAWTGVALLMMGALGVAIALTTLPPVGFTAPFIGFTLILVVTSAARDIRRRRALAALVYLEQAVRLNLPLTPMLASSRLGERPGVARRVLHMEELLAAGTSVADAVEAALPELPGRVLRSVRSGERLGRLPEALARASEGERPREPHDPTRMFYRSYPLLLLAGVSIVVMNLMIFVMPKLAWIFRDFGMPVPAVTRRVMDFAEMLGPVLMIGSALLVLALAGRATWELFSPRRARLGLRWVTDPVEWALPVVGSGAMDRGMADVCWLLAGAVEAGLPIDRAIAEAERLDVNAMLARRIARWREEVEGGASLADGARRARLPHVLVGMLEASTTDLAEVFRFLSRYYATRFSRTQALLRGAFVPVVAVTMGAVVAVVGLSLFVPLIALIELMAPKIGRVL
jgi:type II secretory pathway component PulF